MTAVPTVRLLLWDFGDTLADERWLWTCPDGYPGWTDDYRELCTGAFGRRWNCGAATLDELTAELASRSGTVPKATVVAHIRRCCAALNFFEHAWAAASSRALQQAIVTVNGDIFRDLIVPNYGLDAVFDTIVTSAEEGTEDKAALCAVGAARLGCDDASAALLIDNLEPNVDAWRARGGSAYWFRGDEQFATDFAAGDWNALAAAR